MNPLIAGVEMCTECGYDVHTECTIHEDEELHEDHVTAQQCIGCWLGPS